MMISSEQLGNLLMVARHEMLDDEGAALDLLSAGLVGIYSDGDLYTTPLGQRVIDAALRAANEEIGVAQLGPEAAATLEVALKSARENPTGVDLGSFAQYAEDES